MSPILEIDKYQRQIISILFRSLIIAYSFFLLYMATSTFELYINVSTFILYFLIYFVLLRQNIWLSRLRLLNDFVFITFILLQYNSIDIYSSSLLFAPILNCHNHSGEKKSILLYVFPIVSIFIIIKYVDFLVLVPFILFLLINLFDNIRTKYFRFQQRLNAVIDSFFITQGASKKPYVIYKYVLPIINESKVLYSPISSILCIKIEKDNKVNFINGSKFVWNFHLSNKNEKIALLKKNKVVLNLEIVVDGITFEKNIIIICPINSHYYCFFLIPEKTDRNKLIPFNYFIYKLISPFLYRLANVIDADFNQKKFELNKLYELEDKISYVSNSANAMHFIRNKLGPLKNYLAMHEDYDRSTDPEQRQKIEPFLLVERQKLNSSLSQILERADYILKKSNNPFSVVNTNDFGIQTLFSEIRRVWSYYFDTENFEVNWSIDLNSQRFNVRYNTVGLELVLSNWISNMSRYNSGLFGIRYDETVESYHVTFFNSFDAVKSNCTKFVDEYMSSDRHEILKRDSHGLLEIKDFVSQMQIMSDLHIEDDLVLFSLVFTKFLHDENSDN